MALREIAVQIHGPIDKKDLKYIKEEIQSYNASRIWNGCRGVSLDHDVFQTKERIGRGKGLMWPLIATSIVSFQDYSDEAAIVRFWVQFTDNYNGRLRVYARDDIHGVLYGIPRWIEEGEISCAITRDELPSLVERFPSLLRGEITSAIERNYERALQGEWDDRADSRRKITLVTDARLAHHIEQRFGSLAQAIVNTTRGFIGLLRTNGYVDFESPFNDSDHLVELHLPSSFVSMVEETSRTAGLTVSEMINSALSYSLSTAW